MIDLDNYIPLDKMSILHAAYNGFNITRYTLRSSIAHLPVITTAFTYSNN